MCISSPYSFNCSLDSYMRLRNYDVNHIIDKLASFADLKELTHKEIYSLMRKNNMQEYYEYIPNIIENLDKERYKENYLDNKDIEISKNLFGELWRNLPHIDNDNNKIHYCVNRIELAKGMLRHVVDSNNPKYSTVIRQDRVDRINKMIQKGFGDHFKKPKSLL